MGTYSHVSSARDPLAAALLPVLLHRLNNATQVISSLNSLLGMGPGTAILEDRAGDLAATSITIDELGWLLSVLASSCGADLLLERRRPQGLESLFLVLTEALRREQRDLDVPAARLPDLAPDVHSGWELSWALGSWLLVCARSLPAGSSLSWRLAHTDRGHEFGARSPADGDSSAHVLRRIRDLLPEARVIARGQDSILSLPEGWLLQREELA